MRICGIRIIAPSLPMHVRCQSHLLCSNVWVTKFRGYPIRHRHERRRVAALFWFHHRERHGSPVQVERAPGLRGSDLKTSRVFNGRVRCQSFSLERSEGTKIQRTFAGSRLPSTNFLLEDILRGFWTPEKGQKPRCFSLEAPDRVGGSEAHFVLRWPFFSGPPDLSHSVFRF